MRIIFLTSPRAIDLHLQAVLDLLAPVVSDAARGEFTLDDLESMIRAGNAFAGIAFNDAGEPALAMVFEFRFYPRKQVVNIMALGGRDFAVAAGSFWPRFISWAKESGATEIEACTAPAMTRLLRGLGFQHTYDLVRLPC